MGLSSSRVGRFAKTLTVPARASAAALTKNMSVGPSEEKTVEMIVKTLAGLKGGPTKLGQVLTTFEPAVPEHLIEPYRKALSELTVNSGALPYKDLSSSLHGKPSNLVIEEEAFASASIGQVHRGVWVDPDTGEKINVAVKIQYPNMEKILRSDASQIRMLAYGLRKIAKVDIAEIVNEHINAMLDELDYTLEGAAQEKFYSVYRSAVNSAGEREFDPSRVVIPKVYFATETMLVTRLHEGVSLNTIINHRSGISDETSTVDGKFLSDEMMSQVGSTLLGFTFGNPALVKLVHADPHPGNFLVQDSGQVVVLDYGSIGVPQWYTPLFLNTAEFLSEGNYSDAYSLWRRMGLVNESATLNQFTHLLKPKPDPHGGMLYSKNGFTFSREWLKAQASDYWRPPTGDAKTAVAAQVLTFPSDVLLEHRAIIGTLALLCRMGASVQFERHVVEASSLYPEL